VWLVTPENLTSPKIDSFRSAIWFKLVIPIPTGSPNVSVSLTLNQPKTEPDAHAKNYLAIVCNYCSTKTRPASRTEMHNES